MPKVKVSLAGIGNCSSVLIQGLEYCRKNPEETVGLVDYSIGGIEPNDIEFVAAFDVNDKKVGSDLSDAIFAHPNNTAKIIDVPSHSRCHPCF